MSDLRRTEALDGGFWRLLCKKDAFLHLGNGTHRYRASADFSNLHTFSPMINRTARPASRPASMMFESTEQSSSARNMEAQGYDQWLADISYYEATLGEMAAASIDQNFKEELGAIEQWFSVLTDAERTSALYSLIGQATQVQIRFLIMVLQQKAQQDPLSDILSPANFNKDAMSAAAGQSLSRSLASPSIVKPGPANPLDQAAIQQMFPDAAAALASQRAELNRKRNGHHTLGVPSPSATVQTTLVLPPRDEASRSPWTPSFRKTMEAPMRPKSAEPQNMSASRSTSQSTPLRHVRTDLNAASAPYSPFAETSGGNWASMTNTPATTMFPVSSVGSESLQQRLASVDISRSASNSNSSFVLESDARKFGNRSVTSPSNVEKQNMFESSPLMMYDENGQVMGMPAAGQMSSPLTSRHMTPMMSTPSQNGAWHLINPATGALVFPTSSPALSLEGYHSDNSTTRRRTPQAKPIENPADVRLLNDIPAWLRQLRLHKYTEELKDVKWQELVKMDDAALEAKGISALGARRKLLKAFETVNEAISTGQLSA